MSSEAASSSSQVEGVSELALQIDAVDSAGEAGERGGPSSSSGSSASGRLGRGRQRPASRANGLESWIELGLGLGSKREQLLHETFLGAGGGKALEPVAFESRTPPEDG